MRIEDYIPTSIPTGADVVSGMGTAAEALRNPDFADDILKRLGVPFFIRRIVGKYVRQAFDWAARVIDPNVPNPV